MKVVVTEALDLLAIKSLNLFARQRKSTRSLLLVRSNQPPPSKFFEGLRYVPCDLSKENLNYAWLKGVDAVFHVAAKAGVGGSYKEYFNANFVATKNLMEGCKSYGIQRFIYTSTPSVVFNNQNIRNGNESLPYLETPISPYAFTKAKAEKLVLESHRPREFQTLAIRPHLVWGKGRPPFAPQSHYSSSKKKIKNHRFWEKQDGPYSCFQCGSCSYLCVPLIKERS